MRVGCIFGEHVCLSVLEQAASLFHSEMGDINVQTMLLCSLDQKQTWVTDFQAKLNNGWRDADSKLKIILKAMRLLRSRVRRRKYGITYTSPVWGPDEHLATYDSADFP